MDGQSVGIKQALNVPKKNHLINEQIRVSGSIKPTLGADALSIKQALQSSNNSSNESNHHHSSVHEKSHQSSHGNFDASALHIQHAVNQTKLNRAAPASSSPASNGLRHSVRPGIESRINEFLVIIKVFL